MITVNILLGISGIVIYLTFIIMFRNYNINRKRENMIKNFESYIAVLQLHMDKAYNTIHKDQILIYSLEATTLKDDDFQIAIKDYVKLVEKMIGPTLLKEFIFLYGDYDTFVFNVADYFNSEYENDEIRKASVNEMMESEDEEIQ
jgi:hypothetical protein